MSKDFAQRFDVLVVGGGPAGIAAAVRAAESGVRVGIVDDNPTLGGQIWRGAADEKGEEKNTKEAARWYRRFGTAGITALRGTRVFHQPEPGVLLAEGTDDVYELSYGNLVLATGARERFLPFPGWTLPNVLGAGGLQALVKSGLPIRGKRVVVAGTGPLLLAVAACLRKHGAEILIVCEQAPWSSLARFTGALLGHPAKITQAFELKRKLGGVPFVANSWPVAAHGGEALEGVTVSRAGKSQTFPCDYLACGFHLVPNTQHVAQDQRGPLPRRQVLQRRHEGEPHRVPHRRDLRRVAGVWHHPGVRDRRHHRSSAGHGRRCDSAGGEAGPRSMGSARRFSPRSASRQTFVAIR